MCMYTYIYTHTHAHTQTHTNMHILHIHKDTHMYSYTYKYICIYLRTHTHKYTYIYISYIEHLPLRRPKTITDASDKRRDPIAFKRSRARRRMIPADLHQRLADMRADQLGAAINNIDKQANGVVLKGLLRTGLAVNARLCQR